MSAITPQDTSLITVNKSSEFKKPPLELLWVHGHKNRIPACNISKSTKHGICYVSGSVIIIYDWIQNRQQYFQEHFNDITCMNISRDVKYLITFDYGKKNSLLIWNLDASKVVQSFHGFEDHDELSYLEFSCDSSFVIILKCDKLTKDNSLYIWNWIFENEIPQLTYNFPTCYPEDQNFIATHPEDKYHFLTSSTRNVTFFKVSTTYPITTSDPNLWESNNLIQSVKKFSQSVFLTNNMIVISATSNGKFLIWGCREAYGLRTKYNFVEPCNRIPLRLVEPHSGLVNFTIICVHKNWIVSGNRKGEVYFYDMDLSIIASYRNISKGPITRISFSCGIDETKLKVTTGLVDVSGGKRISQVLPDFVISTENGYCGRFSTQDNKITEIILGQSISAITVSKLSPYIFFGDSNGTIQMWNYEKYKIINTKVLDSKCKNIVCMDLNPISTNLACGLADGTVRIFDVPALLTTPNLLYNISNTKIRLCKFSPNSEFLVCVDNEEIVTLFKVSFGYEGKISNKPIKYRKKILKWNIIGKTRYHRLPIIDIFYDFSKEHQSYRLLTLGRDHKLAIYNLKECLPGKMEIIMDFEFERTENPTCIIGSPFLEKENFFAVVTNDHKIKIHDLNLLKCTKINLLPIYDTPITQLLTISSKKQNFLVFKTNQHIGLILLPVDGNPLRVQAIRADSVGLKQILNDKNDEYIFSYGGSDKSIKMWKINYKSMPDHIDDEDIKPFFHLIPDEHNLIDEIMNAAYALQIQRLSNSFSVGFNIKEDEIMLSDLFYILTSLGYYPSEYELNVLMEEAKTLCKSSNDNKDLKMLSLNDVIKLYINYRPAKSIRSKELMKIFNTAFNLKKHEDISSENFRIGMKEMGESIDEKEMMKLLLIISENELPNVDIFHNLSIDCRMEDIYDATREAKKKNEKLRLNELNWEEFYAEITKKDENILHKFTYRAMLTKLEELKLDTVVKEKTMLDILDELLPPKINEKNICELLQYKL